MPPPPPHVHAPAAPCSPPPPHVHAPANHDTLSSLAASPPPSPADTSYPYARSGQAALRSILGTGNERGVAFQRRLLASAGSTTSSPFLHSSLPILVHFPRSTIALHETLVAALLQAVIGGCAGDFFVAKCDSRIFRFLVSSRAVHDLLLREKPSCIRSCSFVFLPYLPLPPSSPSASIGCSSLDDFLRIPFDLSLQFESIALLHLGSPVTTSTPNDHGCRMHAWLIQFPFKLDAKTLGLILSRLFGGDHTRLNVTFDDERRFSFTVASPAIAALIASFGDFIRPGILLRFPNHGSCSMPPPPTAPRSLPQTTSGTRSFDPAKVRPFRPGFRFYNRIKTRFHSAVAPPLRVDDPPSCCI
ncbi:hypothetical protein ZWY2020_047691 [Hordeum vulgare]|nr:hypothetical protein ZWY2020_047691 [Hordeum vulgare]